ncbi:thiamine pyrophosphate-dependent enzyme, partial [Polymorphobacter multimanifer]
ARAQSLASASPLHPLAVLETLRPLIPAQAIIIEELLSSGMNTVRHLLPATQLDSWFGMRGGGIGVALPWAAGMALAKPGRPLIVLSGDGSLLYSAAALWTLAHYKLPCVILVFNNAGYSILKARTRAIGGHSAASGTYVAMDIAAPAIDFQALAAAHGVHAERAETHAEVTALFTKALEAKAPTLIEVTISKDF